MSISYQLLIVGGGAAGLATASSLKKRNSSLDIGISQVLQLAEPAVLGKSIK